MPLSAGTALGSYQIVAPLGAGGMGEVYRARDTKLNRDVAIKVLPDVVAQDRDRLVRFEREAQLLASLNHPNIAGIYGIEESSGVPALILELVEGPTLADMLAVPGGRPSIDETIEIARQIAVGVEAAHDKGIIHRDLKPANVKRTPDGTVKILDFGLAKALADGASTPGDLSHSPTITAAGTRDGVILGTAAYMSPEQARGQLLDERTDVWAFGCILYELLTGRAAFGGATVSDVLVRVLSGDADWTALPPATPPAIRRLLRRCLEKERRRRLHAIADARIEIEDVREAPVEVSAPPAVIRDRWRWTGWIAAAVAAAVAIALAARGMSRPLANGLIDATPQPLTFDTGLTMTPAISPDGRLVAYASDRAGRGDLDIWVQQTAGGTPLRLTTDPADEQAPDFSPDSSQIVFRSERDGGGVYSVSTLGGEPRLIAREGRRPRFSPDGSRIAYWVGLVRSGSMPPSSTFVISLAGGTPVRLLSEFAVAHDPVWSPDGRALLVTAQRGRTQTLAELDWWVAPVDGREPIATGAARVPAVRASFEGPTPGYQWRDGGVLFSDGTSLWSVPLSADGRVMAAVRRLTLGVERQYDPSISRDERMVFASATATRVIERVSLTSADAQPQSLYTDNRLGEGRTSQTRDGSVLVFTRDREIWMRDSRTGKDRLVLRAEAGAGRSPINATVSPDGERIAYNANNAGYVVETSGGVARRVCDPCQPHGFLSDGKRLLLAPRLTTAEEPLRLVDVISGTGQDIIAVMPKVHFDRPHASPDDRWLAFRREIDNQNKTFVTRLAPGAPPPPDAWQQVDEPTVTGRPAGWSADSRILYLLLDTDGFRCLWAQRVDASGRLEGKPYPARHFHGANESNFGTSFGNAITADGFVLDGTRRVGNIWLLSPAPRP
jgi:dipeptidyl aminopeptidase/acylaminoacyl peptidase